MQIGSCGLHCEVVKHSSFLTSTVVGGDVLFQLKFTVKIKHHFEKRWLDQRAIDEVRTLLLTPPKVGSEYKFVVFANINQFQSNKVCYTVSLCENVQRQSCSRTIPLSNGKTHTIPRYSCRSSWSTSPPLCVCNMNRDEGSYQLSHVWDKLLHTDDRYRK